MFLFSGKQTYYSVFLPSKHCTLYYLSGCHNYNIGDVVIVPCRDEEVPGIVLGAQKYPRRNRPIPLKQMKSIRKKAPHYIEYKFRKIKKEVKKNAFDELAWIDALEIVDNLFGE